MQTTRNLWPLGVVAAILVFIGGTAGLIVLASTQRTDLVSENYYEQEIRYQGRIDSLERTKRLGGRAAATYDAAGKRVTISLPPEHVRDLAAGQIQLYRPSTVGLDRQFDLEPDLNGRQVLDVSQLPKGLWKIRVAWGVEGQEYFLDEKMVIGQ